MGQNIEFQSPGYQNFRKKKIHLSPTFPLLNFFIR